MPACFIMENLKCQFRFNMCLLSRFAELCEDWKAALAFVSLALFLF